MTQLVLIVAPTSDVGSNLARILRGRIKEHALVIEFVSSEKEAKERATTIAFQLIIGSIDLPADESTDSIEGEWRGLLLSQWLQDAVRPRVPIILVAKPETMIRGKVGNLTNVSVVYEGETFEQDLATAVRNSIASTSKEDDRRLKVVINLDAVHETWSYELKGEGFDLMWPGPLEINFSQSSDLRDLIWRSRNVPLLKGRWQGEFRRIGEIVMRQIFLNNPEFYAQFKSALTYVKDDLSRSMIWFRITRNLLPIAFEAIVPNDKNEEFWMLKIPMCRRVEEHPCNREPLFLTDSHEGKINCLIIDASTYGIITGVVDSGGKQPVLDEIRNAGDEFKTLLEHFERSKAKYGIGKVMPISKMEVGEYSFSNFVIQVLKSDEWDIVHFIGHSYYDHVNDRGYLFFPPAKEGDAPEKIEAIDIAPHLSRTRLLYMSSCVSAEEQIIASWAQCGVPAAIGYNWDVDDGHATEYAIEFYKELFSGDKRSLLRAVTQTRRTVHGRHENDPIWAAPVLMVQSA